MLFKYALRYIEKAIRGGFTDLDRMKNEIICNYLLAMFKREASMLSIISV